jgi:hypothetical protein
MNLTEYLSQKSPLRNPIVEINPGQYRVSHSIKVGQETHSYVVIEDPDFVAQFGSIGYLRINTSPSLWTMDNQGNPKARSVFYTK